MNNDTQNTSHAEDESIVSPSKTSGVANEFCGPLTKEIATNARRKVRSAIPQIDRMALDDAVKVIKWWLKSGAVLKFCNHNITLHAQDGTIYNLRAGNDLDQVVSKCLPNYADWEYARDLYDGIEMLALKLTTN